MSEMIIVDKNFPFMHIFILVAMKNWQRGGGVLLDALGLVVGCSSLDQKWEFSMK